MSIETSIVPALAALVIGFGAGYLGSLMVLRRMSLVGDALSHVALPGIAVSLLLDINPFVGAFCALALAVLFIWSLERRTSLPTEALVGIIFTLSLAAGLLLTPEPELLEALFGDISTVGLPDVFISLLVAVGIVVMTSRNAHKMVLGIISPDLARTSGVRLDRINLWFLLSVALVVALGVKVAGTLLTGALVIIPAAAARNVTSSLRRFMAVSAVLGAVSGFFGVWLAGAVGVAPGPMIVACSGVLFGITLLVKR